MSATLQRVKSRVKGLALLAATDPERFHPEYTKRLMSWREDLRRQILDLPGAPTYDVIERALETLAGCGRSTWDAYHSLTTDVLKAEFERLVPAIGGPVARLVPRFYVKADTMSQRLVEQYRKFVQRVRGDYEERFLRRLRDLVFDRRLSMEAAVALAQLETTLADAPEATTLRKPVGRDVVTQSIRRFRQ